MRIVGGSLGGRRISPPAKMPYTRPTTDIAKEGLFNVLQHLVDFEDARTLDLFGGTGAISYELASRGASNLTIVEKDEKMFNFIKNNVREFGLADRINVVRGDVFKVMSTVQPGFDFIFAGPPYALQNIDELPQFVFQYALLAEGGVFVLEHTPRNDYQNHPNFFKMKNYGTTVFSFFQNESEK